MKTLATEREPKVSPTQPAEPNELFALDNPTVLVHGEVDVMGNSVLYTGEFPEALTYSGVGIQIPGFGAFKRISRTPRHYQAVAGIANVSYEPIRSDNQSVCDRLFRPQELHAATIAAIVADLPHNPQIKHIPNAKDIDLERIALEPHSMGGESATIYAEQQPQMVEMIINQNSAGFGSPSFKHIAVHGVEGLVGGVIHELRPYLLSGELDINPVNLARVLRYYFINLHRTIGEAASCLINDVRPSVKRLREAGVKQAFVASEHDFLIPPDDRIKESVDHYRVMKGMGHIGLLAKPHEAAAHVAEAQQQLLAA